jgi:CRISPR-associated protein Cas2
MSGRSAYVVAYDVRNPGRLRRMYKTMRGYGDALQYSVFWCELSPKERELMIGAVHELIHHEQDRVLVIDIGPTKGPRARRVRFLGSAHAPPEGGPVVV